MLRVRQSPRLAFLSGTGGLAILLSGCATPAEPDQLAAAADQCADLLANAGKSAPVNGLTLTKAEWVASGSRVATRLGPQAGLPGHCMVEGHFNEREGTIAGPYRISFRMRLPEGWNGKFYFQGGGGSNGVVGDATGFNGAGNALALARGYAVIAQDSGHDNTGNVLDDHEGQLAFGFDPVARRDYGYSSLKPVYDLGRHLIRAFYGKDSETNIFWGCSKGGQEGMAFAQRYPDAFDGVVAMAPGMSLPRAAVAQAWDTQAFAEIFRARGQTPVAGGFAGLISQAQFTLVQGATLAACDAIDGAVDGIVAAIGRCTTDRVLPELKRLECHGPATGDCLEPSQITALVKVMDGPRNSKGEVLYAAWPWDAGIGAKDWIGWKLGNAGDPASRNVLLGGSSLAAVFTTPPTPLPFASERLLAWQSSFDFDRDAPKIYAVAPPFETSAWQDIGMRSADLSAFRARGGKLIVPHGSSDPVFSVLDTLDWWREVNERQSGNAADFVRVFPVPGMNHCGGGPSTDQFDSLTALEGWVAEGKAPASIPATAGEGSPWPRREMPLCAYPAVALSDGSGGYRCGSIGE